MPAAYPQEFREDVVRVARSREDGVTIAQIAKDFGVHEMTLHKWIRQADIDDGNRPGKSREESTEALGGSQRTTQARTSHGFPWSRWLASVAPPVSIGFGTPSPSTSTRAPTAASSGPGMCCTSCSPRSP